MMSYAFDLQVILTNEQPYEINDTKTVLIDMYMRCQTGKD